MRRPVFTWSRGQESIKAFAAANRAESRIRAHHMRRPAFTLSRGKESTKVFAAAIRAESRIRAYHMRRPVFTLPRGKESAKASAVPESAESKMLHTHKHATDGNAGNAHGQVSYKARSIRRDEHEETRLE